MTSDSIISNSISPDILEKGHQSIRLSADGFSVLVSDAGYAPVLLEEFHCKPEENIHELCLKVLNEKGLLGFCGETVLIADPMTASLVPDGFYDEKLSGSLLGAIAGRSTDTVPADRFIRNRSSWLICEVPASLERMAEQIKGKVHILHVAECLISLADQVRASDHQRGILMAEIQERSLDLLCIREDQIQLYNRYQLKDQGDFIYHLLNTLKQLKMDPAVTAVYLSGTIHPGHELFDLMGKYLGSVQTTPYYLEELSREEILKHMILSEGSKCV